MIITLHPEVIYHKRKTESIFPVYIRVTFKGKHKRLHTNLCAELSDLTRNTYKLKNNTILAKTETLISQIRGIIAEISPFDLENHDVQWVTDRIKEKMREESFSLDFFEWADKYISTKSTKGVYITALNAFERFLGKREIDINAITKMLILDFIEWSSNSPKVYFDKTSKTITESSKQRKGQTSTSLHLMRLANIYQAAKDRYNDEDTGVILIPRSPFGTIPKKLDPPEGQSSIGHDLMQRIISEQTEDKAERIALDAFVISFALMGANMADLYCATNVHNNVWVYNRQKTRGRRADKAEMRVNIPEVLKPYIERLQDGSVDWWLPLLHNLSPTKDQVTHRINRGLKKWCKRNEIPEFTFYAARHTWASLARKEGVEKSLIDECLIHVGDFKMTDIYAERNFALMNSANDKVLSSFSWERQTTTTQG